MKSYFKAAAGEVEDDYLIYEVDRVNRESDFKEETEDVEDSYIHPPIHMPRLSPPSPLGDYSMTREEFNEPKKRYHGSSGSSEKSIR